MAKVRLNPILEQVRGQVGDLVFKRSGEQVILARKPDFSERQSSEAQLAAQERFRQAALYGRMVMADPDTRQLYTEAARDKGQPVFSLTIADFFNAPSVDEVDMAGYTGGIGDSIIIKAHDDFEVSAVKVSLTDADGTAIENGDALQSPPNSGRWVYTATAAIAAGAQVRVQVTATDRPGGAGSSEAQKTLA
jgi:hypothetical protein